MKFISNISKDEYQKYYQESKNSTLLQSYEWGQFCIVGKNQTPYYVGLIDDDNKLICASLLLKRSLPFGYSYFYCPRGFNLDFNDQELLNTFTNELKKFMKQEKVIYLTIDPEIMYKELDNETNVIPNGFNNYHIHDYLLSLGYQHKGFNKLYENNQPRYTFIIDLDQNYESKMHKSFLKNIEKSKKYDLDFYVGNEQDLDIFNNLYNKTKERDDFTGFNEDYYKNFYKIFHPQNMAEIFLCKVYPKKIISTLENDLKDVTTNLNNLVNENKKSILENQKNKIVKDLEFFNQYKNQESVVVSAHIMAFYKDTAVALYAGNDREFQNTYANNYLYYEKIKYSYNHGYKRLDLFGVTGDPKTRYKNLAGIYEFKKQLGGNLIEYVGEYQLTINKTIYKLLTIYRKIKK